jgi:hypothetical protein
MTSRVEVSTSDRRAATLPQGAPSLPHASSFAPAWARARRRAARPMREGAATASSPERAPSRIAVQSSLATISAASPSIGLMPRAQIVREPRTRDVEGSLPTPKAKPAKRRRADAARVAAAAVCGVTTTIETGGWQGLPGVRLVLRPLRSCWHLDWIGPRRSAFDARSLSTLARRFRTCALGVLRIAEGTHRR